MKRLNADTKVHLAHVQAFLINWEVLQEKKYFCFTFSVKKKKKIIISSCEQRPFFLVTLLFSETLSFVIQG